MNAVAQSCKWFMRDILHFLPSTLPNTVGRDDKKSCFDQSHQICHRKQGTKLSFRHSSTLWQMIDNLAPSVTKSMHCSIRTIGNLPWFLTSSTPDDKSTRKCRSGNVPAFFLSSVKHHLFWALALDKDSLDHSSLKSYFLHLVIRNWKCKKYFPKGGDLFQ